MEEARDEREWGEMQVVNGRNAQRLCSRKASLKIRELFKAEEVNDGKATSKPRRRRVAPSTVKKTARRMTARTTTSTAGLLRTALPEASLLTGDVPESMVVVEEKLVPAPSEEFEFQPLDEILEEPTELDEPSTEEESELELSSGFNDEEQMSISSCPVSIVMEDFPKEMEETGGNEEINLAFDPVPTAAFDTYCFCAACNLLIFDYGNLTGEKNSVCQCHPEGTYGFFWRPSDHEESSPTDSFACYRAKGKSLWGRVYNPEEETASSEEMVLFLPGGKKVCFENFAHVIS